MKPELRKGACHCGSVRFEVVLPEGLQSGRRCTCSYCRMRGAIAVLGLRETLKIVEGADKLTLYQFNTRAAKHYFCSVCGIYTHHQRRMNSLELGVNVACLEGVSPFDFPEVEVVDGINHPMDIGETRIAGTLKFVPQ